MTMVEKCKKAYLTPDASWFRLCMPAVFCAGSGTPKFLNHDGKNGYLDGNYLSGDASTAVSRRFDDEEVDEE